MMLSRKHREVFPQQLFPIPYNDIEADRDLQQNPNY